MVWLFTKPANQLGGCLTLTQSRPHQRLDVLEECYDEVNMQNRILQSVEQVNMYNIQLEWT